MKTLPALIIAVAVVGIVTADGPLHKYECELCHLMFAAGAKLEWDDEQKIVEAADKVCDTVFGKISKTLDGLCQSLAQQLIPQLILAEEEGLGEEEACCVAHLCPADTGCTCKHPHCNGDQ